MIRLLPIILLAGCAACRPDIPDDLAPVCINGELNVYSKAAGQRMTMGIACRTTEGRESKRDDSI